MVSGCSPDVAATPHSYERLQLRHAETRGQARRAAAAGADADLDRVDTALGEKPHAFRGRDVAGDELDIGEVLLERVDRLAPSPSNGRARCR